jgi:hypothetical protein
MDGAIIARIHTMDAAAIDAVINARILAMDPAGFTPLIDARVAAIAVPSDTAAITAMIDARVAAIAVPPDTAAITAMIDARVAAIAVPPAGAPDTAELQRAVDAAVDGIPANRFTPGINTALGNLPQRIEDAVNDATRDLTRAQDVLRQDLIDAVALIRLVAPLPAGPTTDLAQRVAVLEQLLGAVDYDAFAAGGVPTDMMYDPAARRS